MDFLFAKGRTPWVFTDSEATKVGAIFERDLARGEALTAFDEKSFGLAGVEIVEKKTPKVTRNEDQV